MNNEERAAKIDDARSRIEEAIYDIITLRDTEDAKSPVEGAPMVLAWGVAYEFVTSSMDGDDETADGVIVASDSQSRSTSRGVFGLGVDHFTR